jgi:hypothetical protein
MIRTTRMKFPLPVSIVLALLLWGMIIWCIACMPTAPRDVRRIDPPEYARYFEELRACSGLQRGDFNKLEFFSAPHPLIVNGKPVGGQIIFPNKIYIDELWINEEYLIKHEEMHYFIYESLFIDSNIHPPHYFNDVCGNLMSP